MMAPEYQKTFLLFYLFPTSVCAASSTIFDKCNGNLSTTHYIHFLDQPKYIIPQSTIDIRHNIILSIYPLLCPYVHITLNHFL